MGLKDKTVIITGGNSGIGKACAIAFSHKGAKVVIAARRLESAEKVVKQIIADGGEAIAVQTDIRDIAQVNYMVEQAVKAFTKIDILVNNAGITADAFLDKMTITQWNDVITTNLTGSFYCIKAVLPHMLEQKFGRIINTTSVAAKKGAIAQANYAASKAGIIGMTLSLAQELGTKNITVNAIAPGYVSTDMIEHIPEKIKQRAIEIIPIHRFGTPEEIAAGFVYLASDEAAYCNGTILDMNGGISI